MKITIEIDPASPMELRAFDSFMAALKEPKSSMPTRAVTDEPKAEYKKTTAAEPEVKKEPEKVQEPEPEKAQAPETKEGELSQETLRELIKPLVAKHRDVLKDKLNELCGVQEGGNITKLPQDQYPAFYEFLKTLS